MAEPTSGGISFDDAVKLNSKAAPGRPEFDVKTPAGGYTVSLGKTDAEDAATAGPQTRGAARPAPDKPLSFEDAQRLDETARATAPPPSAPAPPERGVRNSMFDAINGDVASMLGLPADLGAAIMAPTYWRSLPEETKAKWRTDHPYDSAIQDFLDKASANPTLGRQWWEEVMQRGIPGMGGAVSKGLAPPTGFMENAASAAGHGIAGMAVPGLGAEAAVARDAAAVPAALRVAGPGGDVLARTWMEGDQLSASLGQQIRSAAIPAGTLEHMLAGGGFRSNVLMGLTGGVVGEAAKEVSPPWFAPTAEAAGNVVGAMPVAAAGSFIDRLMNTMRQHLDTSYSAARSILRDASNPDRFRASLANAPSPPPAGQVNPESAFPPPKEGGDRPFVPAAENVPGSVLTAGEATGDKGVLSLEQAAAGRADTQARFRQRAEEQNQARLDAMEKERDPAARGQAVKDYVRQRLDDLSDEHTMRVEMANRDLADTVAKVGGDRFSSSEYGADIRRPFDDLHRQASDEDRRLFSAIDPTGSVPVDTADLKAGFAASGSVAKSAKPPSGEENRLLSVVADKYGPTESFGELAELRDAVSRELRKQRVIDENGAPFRRLTVMLRVVDDQLATNAGKIAETPQGETMVDNLRRENDEHFASNENAPQAGAARAAGAGGELGAGASGEGAGPVPGGGVRPAPVEEGAAGGQPAAGQGTAGVQEEPVTPPAANDEPTAGPGAGRTKSADEMESELAATKEQWVASGRTDEAALDRMIILTNQLKNARTEESTATATSARTEAEAAGRAAVTHADQTRQTFEDGPVGAMLRPGAEEGSFRMPDGSVVSHVVDDPDNFAAVDRAAKGDPDVGARLRDAAAFSMRQAATVDGAISPSKLRSWVAGHGHVLDRFPDLGTKLRDVQGAQAAADEAIANQKQALAGFQDLATKRLLGTRNVTDAVVAALPNPEEFGSLVDRVSADPDARAGLRRTVVDHLIETARTSREAGTSGMNRYDWGTIDKLLSRYGESMSKLFSPDELSNMRAVVKDFQDTQRIANAVRGSDYVGRRMSNLGLAAVRIGSELGGMAIGAMTGHGGLGHVFSGGTAGYLTGVGADAALVSRMGRVENLAADMMLDKNLALPWLNKVAVTEANQDSLLSGLARRMRAADINALRAGAQDENDGTREQLRPFAGSRDSEYRAWLRSNDLREDPDYDMRGAFAAGERPDPETHHMTDRYKLPSHITFSDESKYSDGGAGHWEKEGGRWTFTPGTTNLKNHSPQELRDYFRKYEPDSNLNMR